MPIEKWSESVLIAHLANDPQFSEDISAIEPIAAPLAAVLDFAAVHFINSSNIAQLLRLRRRLLGINGKLILCGITNQIWSTFLLTGLDKIFDFSENVPTALATLQISGPKKGAK
jgi:anti-anti-sigma factor